MGQVPPNDQLSTVGSAFQISQKYLIKMRFANMSCPRIGLYASLKVVHLKLELAEPQGEAYFLTLNDITMKKSRFTEQQIISAIKENEAGVKPSQVARKHGISEATFYNWKAKYGGMDTSQLKRLKELEAENGRLKRMFADLSLTHEAFKDAVEKKL